MECNNCREYVECLHQEDKRVGFYIKNLKTFYTNDPELEEKINALPDGTPFRIIRPKRCSISNICWKSQPIPNYPGFDDWKIKKELETLNFGY